MIQVYIYIHTYNQYTYKIIRYPCKAPSVLAVWKALIYFCACLPKLCEVDPLVTASGLGATRGDWRFDWQM